MADLSATSWSETDASNDVTPPAGWPAGMQPNQVEPTARAEMGGIKRFWNRINPTYTTSGSAGAYVLTPSNTSYPTAYVQGESYAVKANFTSVGADTLNVNSLGALPIYKFSNAGAVAIAAGDIQNGQMVDLVYDSALDSGGGGFQLTTVPISGGIIPSGSIMAFASTTAPAGWAVCDGTAISRTGNAALFAAIGTAYGSGDGSTTFNKPDCRGRFLAGYDASNSTSRLTLSETGGMSASTLANTGGEQAHTLVTGELAAHNHGINDPTHNHSHSDPGHGHGVNDPTHIHGVGDPGHGHGVSDPGHVHTYYGNNNGATYGQGSSAGDGGPVLSIATLNTGGGGTGVSVNGAGTGVYLGYAATSISIQSSGSSISNVATTTGITTQNNGSGTPHNNVPPGIIVYYIIKL